MWNRSNDVSVVDEAISDEAISDEAMLTNVTGCVLPNVFHAFVTQVCTKTYLAVRFSLCSI
jgi:hypothetical protein